MYKRIFTCLSAAVMMLAVAAPGWAIESNLVSNPEWLAFKKLELAEKDYEENKALNAIVNMAILVDWYLTSSGVKNIRREEINPFLGPKPDQGQIGLYFLSILLGNLLLPKIFGPQYADIVRSHLLAAEIPCLESWTKPNYDWSKAPPWQITIPFKF